MRRLLIVACSATKDPSPGLMPALDRYRGAYYQMIRQVPADELPEIVILSAKFGFIGARDLIRDYEQVMDWPRVHELLANPRTCRELGRLASGQFSEIFVAAGLKYREVIGTALKENAERIGFQKLIYAAGGIGEQRSQLKAWLNKSRGC